MKQKIVVLIVFLALTLICTWSLPAKEKHYFIEKPKPGTFRAITPENAREKREYYLWLKKRVQDQASHCSLPTKTCSLSSPNAGELTVIGSSVYMQPDPDGKLYITGLCQNVSEPQAVLIFITFEFFDPLGASLGTTLAMAFGESCIQAPTDDGILCLNAMHPGEKGFFLAWSEEIAYSAVDSYTYTFYYGTPVADPLPLANTRLSIDEIKYQELGSDRLKATATVKNSCSTHGSAYTFVALALFDSTNTQVVDANASYAGGTSSAGYHWAVYPLESETVDIIYYFAREGEIGSKHQASFMFYEGEVDVAGDAIPPFGEFATPANGAVVRGSIPVTGWALDDISLKGVKIYREEGGGLVYIGDANFVDGARPDVEATKPGYPNNDKAGWGYMLLTNFLPNGGNGTFVLHAIATDRAGKTTSLPNPKTIICDNAHAVLPFGAIDTPGQGGIANGSSFVIWGWVLTPQPNQIPTDGSTIKVYVDGVNLGNPTYNIYNENIANLFPGYANSGGAMGYFILDTTLYEDGLHTIQWSATDNAGNNQGIGSRYFFITNGDIGDVMSRTTDFSPGFPGPPPMLSAMPKTQAGASAIDIRELDRLEIHLDQGGQTDLFSQWVGCQVVGQDWRPLPIGSTLDMERGIFYWQAGHGFLGQYHLVFFQRKQEGTINRKDYHINITPRN